MKIHSNTNAQSYPTKSYVTKSALAKMLLGQWETTEVWWVALSFLLTLVAQLVVQWILTGVLKKDAWPKVCWCQKPFVMLLNIVMIFWNYLVIPILNFTETNLLEQEKPKESFQCGIIPHTTLDTNSMINHIVGGSDAEPNSIPWQVALMYRGSQSCGGSLITSQHVVTAAHCTKGKDLKWYFDFLFFLDLYLIFLIVEFESDLIQF